MALKNEEKRDDLFGINLGDNMIDIPEGDEGGDGDKNNPPKKTETDEDVVIHDDGSFEVDEFDEVIPNDDDDDIDDEDKVFDKSGEKGKTPSKPSKSDSSPSSSPYLAFAKDRVKEGVFLDFSDEEWNELVEKNEGDEAQALRELHSLSVSEMIRSNVERFKESLSPEEKVLYEAKEKGLPLDKYAIAKRNFTKYSSITPEQVEENETVQEDLVRKFLEFRGFSSDEIEEEIAGYKGLEKLKDKALKALEVVPKAYQKEIKDIEDTKTAEEQQIKDSIRQRVAKMKSLITNTPEIIPGIKLDKTIKEKIMESMTVPVSQDKQGNPLNSVMVTRSRNPEAFEMLIHYYHQLGLFNIGEDGTISPDFSKISKVERKKAVDSMRTAFESKQNVNAGRSPKVKTTDDELDEFDKAFRRL